MLKLYFHEPVTDPNVFYIDDYFNLVKDKTWFNSMAVRLIEEIDGNRHIGDGVSESPVLGIISPGELSGSIKTIIYAMNNPDVICPLQWVGQNLSEILVDVSNAYDMSFVYNGSYFKFDAKQKMVFPEYSTDVIVGRDGFDAEVKRYDLYETINCGFEINFDEVSDDSHKTYTND